MRSRAGKAPLTIVLVVVLVLERWGGCCLIKPPFDVRRYVSEPKTTRSIADEDHYEARILLASRLGAMRVLFAALIARI
jgi:hypothetical protein